MRPGGWWGPGFLLPGQSLQDVLERDRATLEARGASPASVGAALEALVRQASAQDGRGALRIGALAVEVVRRRGFITCPWAPDELEPCPAGSGFAPRADTFRVVRPATREAVAGHAVTAHMILAHGFFGGPGTSLRIEPEQALRVVAPP